MERPEALKSGAATFYCFSDFFVLFLNSPDPEFSNP